MRRANGKGRRQTLECRSTQLWLSRFPGAVLRRRKHQQHHEGLSMQTKRKEGKKDGRSDSECERNDVLEWKQCGECVPGTSGVEDTMKLCDINEYCSDEGLCTPTKESPLYNQPCPFEQGGPTARGWCGPGLRCFQHVCLPCQNGYYDPKDGKRCVNYEWFDLHPFSFH